MKEIDFLVFSKQFILFFNNDMYLDKHIYILKLLGTIWLKYPNHEIRNPYNLGSVTKTF